MLNLLQLGASAEDARVTIDRLNRETGMAPSTDESAIDTRKSSDRLKGEENSAVDLTGVPYAPPICPKCKNSEMWDNIASEYWGNGLGNSGAKKPVFTCNNKSCGHSIWAKMYQHGQLPDDYFLSSEDNPANNSGETTSLDRIVRE